MFNPCLKSMQRSLAVLGISVSLFHASATIVSTMVIALFPITASASTVTDSLVGYWKLDETSSGATVIDYSGSGYHGTGSGALAGTKMAQPTTDIASGFTFTNTRGKDFDGTDDGVIIGDHDGLTLGSRATFALWMNTDVLNGQHRVFFAKRYTSAAEYQFGLANTNQLKISLLTGGTVCCTDIMENTTTLSTGTWYHVAVTFDDNTDTLKWYVNGVNTETDTVLAKLGVNSTGGLMLGKRANGQEPFNGKMDDIRIYNRVLSDDEIETLAGKDHLSAIWQGLSGVNWENAANWNINAVPDNYTNITIPNRSFDPYFSSGVSVVNLEIENGALLHLHGHNFASTENGTLTNNGTLSLYGNETISSITLDNSTGTVMYTGTGNYSGLKAGNSYYNLSLSGSGSRTLTANLDVNGSLLLSSGSLAQGAFRANVGSGLRIAQKARFVKSTNGSMLTLDGDYILQNESSSNLGRVQIGTSPDTITLGASLVADFLKIEAGDVLVTDGYNVRIGTGGIANSGTLIASAGNGGTTLITSASGFTNNGTFTAGNSSLTLSGALRNTGTFTSGTSTVTLDGGNQSVVGDFTFYNFAKIVASAATLTFTAGDLITIQNALTLQGAAGNVLSLRSSLNGTQWEIDPRATQTVEYLNVRDSKNINAAAVRCVTGCTVAAQNNINWSDSSATPTVSSLSPEDNSNSPSSSVNLVVTFTESVTPVSGNITIKKGSDDSTVETIDVNSARITGAGTPTIGIDLVASLTLSTDYYVLIDSGAFEDSDNNAYEGISDERTWNFTTAASDSASSSSRTTTTSGGGGGTRGSPDYIRSKITDAHTSLQEHYEKNMGGPDSPTDSGTETPEQFARTKNLLLAYVNNVPIVYKDVPKDSWFAPFVSYLIAEKIATGYADAFGNPIGEFGVGNPVTIAEVLKMALNSADHDIVGMPAPQNRSAQNSWAASYVAKAESLGIAGISQETDVFTPASRGYAIALIIQILDLPSLPQDTDQVSPFKDVPTDHPHRNAILSAYVLNLMQGDRDADGRSMGTFRPDDTLNRAEMAKITALAELSLKE